MRSRDNKIIYQQKQCVVGICEYGWVWVYKYVCVCVCVGVLMCVRVNMRRESLFFASYHATLTYGPVWYINTNNSKAVPFEKQAYRCAHELSAHLGDLYRFDSGSETNQTSYIVRPLNFPVSCVQYSTPDIHLFAAVFNVQSTPSHTWRWFDTGKYHHMNRRWIEWAYGEGV